LTAALRAHLAMQLGLALGRFGERIGPVSVRLSASGKESRCEIEVGLRPRKLLVEDQDLDPFLAVNQAVGRVGGKVARAIERDLERAGDASWPPSRAR
jgi:ribosome-associated translation inhibitor RaiA